MRAQKTLFNIILLSNNKYHYNIKVEIYVVFIHD